MATWVIGDVHGQQAALDALLAALRLDEASDRLWLAGDLVNRGPSSLAVLRRARRLADCFGDRFVAVLGNHELHFVARARSLADGKRRDRLDELLAAPDAPRLADWLLQWPLLHREHDVLLVHAGLHPNWSADEATDLARRAAARLAGPRPDDLLAASYGSRRESPVPSGLEPLAEAVQVLTRVRGVRQDGTLDPYTGPPEDAPAGTLPWFELRSDEGEPQILFGHWAALGLLRTPGAVCLDSGAAWCRTLTALRLDDGAIVQVDVPPEDP